jgi:hypothetical protein
MFFRTSVISFTCACSLAAVSQAQTIVPIQREDDAEAIEKDDIFDRLTPLAPAAAPLAQTNEISPTDVLIDDEPATTLRLREPEQEPVVAEEKPSAAEASPRPAASVDTSVDASPAPLSPKLRALLTPARASASSAAHAPGAMTMLSAEELRTLIGYGAQAFREELGKLQHGERWEKYLRLSDLEKACRPGASAEVVEQLPEIGLRFNSLAAKEEYKSLTKRHGFQTLKMALGEYLSLDDQRVVRQQLLTSVAQLQESLAPVATGPQWSGYFELSALQRLATNPTPVSQHDLVQLQLLLARFEQAATDEKFTAVARLDGFEATQASLRNVLGVSRRPTAEDVEIARAEPAEGEFTIPDDASAPLAQASATVERLPVSLDDLQLVALNGKAYLRQQGDAAWQQIGKIGAKPGDTIAARDQPAQLVLGECFALQLAAETALTVAPDPTDKATIDVTLAQGSVRAIANAQNGGGKRLRLRVSNFELTAVGDDFAVEFRVEKDDGRAVAIVHSGEASVENKATGDRAVVKPGREAVLLVSGVALRGAPPKSDNWWMKPTSEVRSARRNGGGFSR